MTNGCVGKWLFESTSNGLLGLGSTTPPHDLLRLVLLHQLLMPGFDAWICMHQLLMPEFDAWI